MASAESVTRQDWVDLALETLRKEGHAGLRAVPLAEKLGVTRGSFYWHFKDVGDLHDAVLQMWKETATDDLIARSSGEGDPRERLRRLIVRVFSAPPNLERAVQAWAVDDPRAAKAAAAVNENRLEHLNRLFLETGLSKSTARARASLMYWTFLGRLQTPDLPGGAERVRELCALFDC
jgi:AcrR family transcriptional regulator